MTNPPIEYNPQYRPRRVQKVTHLPQAEKWRQTILGEISTTLTRLNDPATTESNLRLLNDNLNRLYKEKRAWEYHIRKLGGPDYFSHGGIPIASLVSVDGYRYFGRTRDLPDIKQLLAKQQAHKSRTRNSTEVVTSVDTSGFGGNYYGRQYPLPVAKSANALLAAYGYPLVCEVLENDAVCEFENQRSKELLRECTDDASESPSEALPNFVALPSEKEIEAYLVDHKRQQLMTRLGIQQ